MNSPRNISTVYEPATFGSRIIYGDSNETVRMIVMCLQKLADQFGQPDVVKANWDTVSREVVSYIYAIDSWAYLCSGCLEWGGPGTVDMLNSEVGCMMEYARLAQIAGDEAEYAQAIYRAARRACPTMARFVMQDYYGDNGLAGIVHTKQIEQTTLFEQTHGCYAIDHRRILLPQEQVGVHLVHIKLYGVIICVRFEQP